MNRINNTRPIMLPRGPPNATRAPLAAVTSTTNLFTSGDVTIISRGDSCYLKPIPQYTLVKPHLFGHPILPVNIFL